MSTNLAKMLIWKHANDVKLWRHKQRTPNTNEHHMTLNEPPPSKFSAYATAARGEAVRYKRLLSGYI